MRKATLIAILVLTQGVAQADGVPPSDKFRLEISKKNQLSIYEGERSRQVRLIHEIYGYEVNCSKTKVLVWGKPKNLNKDNPQDSILTIVNLKYNTKSSIIEFTKNIFDVVFLADGVKAIVGSDSEKFIDITRGVLLDPGDGASINPNANLENCKTFPNKSYRRYKN